MIVSLEISFNSIIINGSWDASKNTAGGCRNFPTFVNNPQYLVELSEDADGDNKCSVVIALMQKNRRAQKNMGVQELCIGYTIYKVSPLTFSIIVLSLPSSLLSLSPRLQLMVVV